MPTVLIASDKFKGSLTAAQVADAVGEGVRRARPDSHVDSVPVADGGDGTVAAALAAGFEHIPVVASGPTGEPVHTGYARRADLAVVEMADVAGLIRLSGGVLAPLDASSRGVGEVMAAAIAAGCRTVVLGVGGSASTDGGAGLLAGLGALLQDADGSRVRDGGSGLARIASVDLATLHERMAGVRVILASESGVLDVPSAEIVAKGRLQPGKMFLIDTAEGRIVPDDEIKESLSKQEPYAEWLHSGLLDLKTMAVSRLMLDNFPHIKAYWVMLGIKTAQVALGFGADDLDGTVVHEKIYHDAGSDSPQELSVAEIRRLIEEAGRVPVERDTLYNEVVREEGRWQTGRSLHLVPA